MLPPPPPGNHRPVHRSFRKRVRTLPTTQINQTNEENHSDHPSALLWGLLFIFSGGAGLLNLMPKPQLTGVARAFHGRRGGQPAISCPCYIGHRVCSLVGLLVIGFYVPLALVMIFPVVLNILLHHIFVDPNGLPVAIPLMLINLFLAFHYRKHYQALHGGKINT